MLELIWRVAVTALGVALPTVLAGVSLPGLQSGLLDPTRQGGAQAVHTSLAALGLDAVLLAFVLVEVAALAVPGWRPLRRGAGRVQLMRVTFVVAAVLLVAQALFAAWALRAFGWELIEPGLAALLVDAGALVLGTSALLLGARIVTRWGTGHGLSVVAVLGAVPAWLERAEASTATAADSELLARTLIIAAIGTLALLGREVRGERMPVAGLVPLLLPGWAMQGLTLLGTFVAVDLSALYGPSLSTVLTVSTLLTLGLAYAEQRQPTLAALRSRGVALAVSALVPLLVVLGDLSLHAELSFSGAAGGLAFFVLAVACTMDVLREASLRMHLKLMPILAFSDIAVADRVGARLAEADVPYVLRGLGHRTLLRFFGPWVPVKLLVEPARAAEALQLARAEANREAYEEITRFF